MKKLFPSGYLLVSMVLLSLALILGYLGFLGLDWSHHFQSKLEQIRRDIQVARTLVGEERKDTYTDLLSLLSKYCRDSGVPLRNCLVQTQKPVSREEHISRKYVVTMEPVLMDKVLDYYQKLDGLPDNVRVIQSTLKRVQQKARKGKQTQPHLLLRVEMNEIKFTSTDSST
ncbi:hypothetical protein HOF92_01305 [bacterium]|jgi:hypothetical protein|nr:hypothetical protein [bacterium]